MTDAVSITKPSRLARLAVTFSDRRVWAMLILSFAAGIPNGAVLGTLSAWFAAAEVNTTDVGTFSLIGIAYSFKFLWSPAFLTPRSPLPFGIGPRRTWLLVLQIPIAAGLFLLALSNPPQNLGLAAAIGAAVVILSASHDIILDAWRIEVAKDDTQLDVMSGIYQWGYRLSGLLTGMVALILAEKIGWFSVYLIISFAMLVAISGTFLAPEPDHTSGKSIDKTAKNPNARPSFIDSLPTTERDISTLVTFGAWVISAVMIGVFIYQSFATDSAPTGSAFVKAQGPIIISLSIMLPGIISAVLLYRFKAELGGPDLSQKGESLSRRVLDTLFRSILDPLIDVISRFGGLVILIVALILTYRFTDSVWGTFAYWFYLGKDFGALGHSMTEVAFASKTFGVIMTMLGSFLGLVAVGLVGRRMCLIVGAVISAATNLLFADLAAGGSTIQGFINLTNMDILFAPFAPLFGLEATPELMRLTVAITGENLAGGFASVAFVAWLTGIVNPRFAAVQYALFASLALLIGTLGRPWIGQLMETQGFYTVFIITFWLGMVAVILSVVEAIFYYRDKDASKDSALTSDTV